MNLKMLSLISNDWRYPGMVHAFVRTRASQIFPAVRVCGFWSADILVRLRLTRSKEADKNVRAPKNQETHGSRSARRDRLIPAEPLFSSPAHEPQNAFLDFQRLAHLRFMSAMRATLFRGGLIQRCATSARLKIETLDAEWVIY
jgi:hypothetical protein